MYLRPIQVPKGALIRTQRIIIIFFLKTGIGWRMIMSSSWVSPARLLLVFKSFFGVGGGPSCVLNRVVHVGVDSEISDQLLVRIQQLKEMTSEENLWQSIPIDDLPLLLNKHRHVHEHLVELLDRRLQLHEHLVPDDQGSRNLGWSINFQTSTYLTYENKL